MKQRITYLVRRPDEFQPTQLRVGEASLELDRVDAAKEHRVTFGLRDLPREVVLLLHALVRSNAHSLIASAGFSAVARVAYPMGV